MTGTKIKNAYESGHQKNIPAVLIYAFNVASTEVLMIHRNTRDIKQDLHSGKWNGLGGKCEQGETYFEAVVREFAEESGLNLDQSRFEVLGFVHFPNFKAHKNEDWSVMVLVCTIHSNEMEKVKKSNPEGDLHWIAVDQVMSLNLWPGDQIFLPSVFKREKFFASIQYHDGQVSSYRLNS